MLFAGTRAAEAGSVRYDELMTGAAYLRVYLPMDGLRSEERRRWEGRPALDVRPAAPVITASAYGLLSEPLADDALLTEWSGRRFVCPRHPRLRVLEGLLAFHNAFPSSRLVPELTVRRAAAELHRLQRRQPRARSHILTSPWHVPLRWFAAFSPDEREVRDLPKGTTIRYRTARHRASDRLSHAVDVLAEAGFEDEIVEQVEDLAEWLIEFPPDAMVELDYGSVAGLFSSGDLAVDESAAEVWASLEALERGDFEDATEHYSMAASRWAAAQAVTYSN